MTSTISGINIGWTSTISGINIVCSTTGITLIGVITGLMT
jgi:hypothetical protein